MKFLKRFFLKRLFTKNEQMAIYHSLEFAKENLERGGYREQALKCSELMAKIEPLIGIDPNAKKRVKIFEELVYNAVQSAFAKLAKEKEQPETEIEVRKVGEIKYEECIECDEKDNCKLFQLVFGENKEKDADSDAEKPSEKVETEAENKGTEAKETEAETEKPVED